MLDRSGGPPRIAVFPLDNMAAVAAPVRAIDGQIVRSMTEAGLTVVAGEEVENFLARHRLRYTGGINGESAAAAHEELGVDAILLASVQGYEATPARLAVTMRLVAARADASIVWMDASARVGNDSPGVLGLGVISDYRALEERELRRVASSAAAALAGDGPRVVPCPDERRFRPRIAFRSPDFDPARSYSVAVLPFLNETQRRRAGDVMALEFVRQFAAVDRLRVVEPGVVRDRLINYRVIMDGGISVDTARMMLDTLQADLVVTGYVREYSESGDPSVEFTVVALDRQRGRVMWESTSHATGVDGVWLFDFGRISTANALACRMASNVVAAFVGGNR